MIESILLTAGRSSRMGQDKALLKIGEISVIEHILRELIPISESVIIVFGKNYELIKEHLQSSFLDLSNVHFSVNHQAHLGMYSSIKNGFSAVSGKNPVLLHMIDQPFVAEEIYTDLVESFDDTHLIFQPAITSGGKKKIGHPILFAPAFIKDILAEPNDGNLRGLIGKFPHKRKFVEVNDKGILQNINTLEEFKKTIKEMKFGNTCF